MDCYETDMWLYYRSTLVGIVLLGLTNLYQPMHDVPQPISQQTDISKFEIRLIKLNYEIS